VTLFGNSGLTDTIRYLTKQALIENNKDKKKKTTTVIVVTDFIFKIMG
jgi:hypothetical protein